MDSEAPAERRTVTFPGALGDDVVGTLEHPDGELRGAAVFAHCFTCSRKSHAASRVSKALADRGFAVLRFDFTGLGESEGDFADTTFTSNVEDLRAAVGWLGEEVAPVRLLVGHSLGGAAVIAAAGELDQVEAVATIAAPSAPSHVTGLIQGLDEDRSEGGEEDPVVSVDIGGRPFRLRQSFIRDVFAADQEDRIIELRRPLLILHSPSDLTVGVDNAREIFEAARPIHHI